MDEYRQLFQFLQLPKVAADIAARNVSLPIYTESPFDTYGFVPALLPLWSGEVPSYTGYWRHWFGSRQMTLVEVIVENKRRTQEIARTFDQLARELVLSAIDGTEELTLEIRTFGTQLDIGTAELRQIEQLWREWGDEKTGLLSLPSFSSAVPLVCLSEGEAYTGDFPHDGMMLNEETLRNVCTTETSRELHQHIATLPFAPPWFVTTEQSPVFNQLLSEKDYLGAWMSLNSNGWKFLEAKEALRQLAQKTNVPGLDLLAQVWAAVPHEKNGINPQSASY